MATYVPAKVSTQFIFFASLISQANTKLMQVNPTIAAGDFKVSIDGGALANLATLPAVTPAGSSMVKFTLSTTEMAGANATVVCIDAAGSEWCDLTVNIQTSARQIDDLATPTNITAGTITTVTNLTNVSAGGITAASIATGAIDADALAADAVDEIWDEVMEGTTTARQSMRLANSANGAKLSGAATTTVAIRDLADSKDRVSATVDADGNRSAVTLDLT